MCSHYITVHPSLLMALFSAWIQSGHPVQVAATLFRRLGPKLRSDIHLFGMNHSTDESLCTPQAAALQKSN